MPIYEYSCRKCGKTIEVIQKFSDPVLKKHQGCGGALTKLISASGFQFKGSGWYVTDYARKGNGGDSEAAKDTTEKKESTAKAETSSKESSKKTGKSGKSSD
jgi:putative FmdB family regulatory protein